MEFSGIGVLHLESPSEQLRPFFRRKFKTFFRNAKIAQCPFLSIPVSVLGRAYNMSGSGVITKQDMEKLAHQVSLSISEKDQQSYYKKQFTVYQELILFFKEKITEEEFMKEWENICFGDEARKKTVAERFRDLIKTSFASVDTNRDGIISYEEFRKYYEIRNQNPKTLKVVFESIDTNDDGAISFEEWCHTIVSSAFVRGPESSFSLFYRPLVED